METTSQELQPVNTNQHQCEVMLSYLERQHEVRAQARERITANMQDTDAKLTWINADQQLHRLFEEYCELRVV